MLKDFKPNRESNYMCLEEFEVFENIGPINGHKKVCLWNNPAFKKIERGG